MTKISAQIVADSKNEFGNRITTMVLTYPRIIHAEIMTHRMFSRNAASSRAVPFNKLVESVENDPFIPMAWQKDHKGMQGTEYFNKKESRLLDQVWLNGRDEAVKSAKDLAFGIGVRKTIEETGVVLEEWNTPVTKQLCNRLLEPFQWYTTIVTATEWENFFALRCPQYSLFHENVPLSFRSKKDLLNHVHRVEAPEFKNDYDNLTDLEWLQCNKGQAEIHLMALAEQMWDAMNKSTPKELKAGEWHICYEDKIKEIFNLDQSVLDADGIPKTVKVGSIMAARTSYTVVGTDLQEWTVDKYCDKAKELSTANPLHASPFEHCAKASDGWSGNFRGFIQYRKMFENENIK